MRELNDSEIEMCAGGLKMVDRQSDNVIDRRGIMSRNLSTGDILGVIPSADIFGSV